MPKRLPKIHKKKRLEALILNFRIWDSSLRSREKSPKG